MLVNLFFFFFYVGFYESTFWQVFYYCENKTLLCRVSQDYMFSPLIQTTLSCCSIQTALPRSHETHKRSERMSFPVLSFLLHLFWSAPV